MKLKKIEIQGFGGFLENSYEFNDGINVFLGPNESGKSTIYRALEAVLFFPSSKKKDIEKWFTLGSEQSAEIKLTFTQEGNDYTLNRKWGHNKEDKLICKLLNLRETKAEDIEKTISDLLVNKKIYNFIVFTSQMELAKTIEMIGKNKEAISSVEPLLKETIDNTFGISVHKFTKKLNEKYDNYFDYWDAEKQLPLLNKWVRYSKKSYGELANAFFLKNDLRKKFIDTSSDEEEIMEIDKEISEIRQTMKESQDYLNSHRNEYDDCDKYLKKQNELDSKKNDFNRRKEDLKKWKDSENELIDCNRDLDKHSKELKHFSELNDNFTKIKTYRDLIKYKKEYEEATKNLNSVTVLTQDNLSEMEKIDGAISINKTKLEEKVIRAKFKSSGKTELSIKKGIEDYTTKVIPCNNEEIIKANGKLTLKHADWTLEVESGELDVEEIIRIIENNTQQLSGILRRYGINGIEEAKKLYEDYYTANRNYEMAKLLFNPDKHNIELENLKNELGDSISLNISLDTGDIREKIGELKGLKENDRKNIENIEKEIGILRDNYSEINSLKMLVSTEEQTIEILKGELEELKGKIAHILDIDNFKKEFEIKSNDLHDKTNSLPSKFEERLQYQDPYPSSEELKEELDRAEEKFEKIKSEANSLELIKIISEDIKKQLDDPFEKLRIKIERYFSQITGFVYEEIRLSEDSHLPEIIPQKINQYVRDLKIENLSTGTLDSLALALRLSLADFFLKEGGFIVLDDPMVNLDTERQKNAAELLKDISKKKQLIIFTCHPKHAQLLVEDPKILDSLV